MIQYSHYLKKLSIQSTYQMLTDLDEAYGNDWLAYILKNLDSIGFSDPAKIKENDASKDTDPSYFYAHLLATFVKKAPKKIRKVSTGAKAYVFRIIKNRMNNIIQWKERKEKSLCVSLPIVDNVKTPEDIAIDNLLRNQDDVVVIKVFLRHHDPEEMSMELGISKSDILEIIKKFQLSLFYYYLPRFPPAAPKDGAIRMATSKLVPTSLLGKILILLIFICLPIIPYAIHKHNQTKIQNIIIKEPSKQSTISKSKHNSPIDAFSDIESDKTLEFPEEHFKSTAQNEFIGKWICYAVILKDDNPSKYTVGHRTEINDGPFSGTNISRIAEKGWENAKEEKILSLDDSGFSISEIGNPAFEDVISTYKISNDILLRYSEHIPRGEDRHNHLGYKFIDGEKMGIQVCVKQKEFLPEVTKIISAPIIDDKIYNICKTFNKETLEWANAIEICEILLGIKKAIYTKVCLDLKDRKYCGDANSWILFRQFDDGRKETLLPSVYQRWEEKRGMLVEFDINSDNIIDYEGLMNGEAFELYKVTNANNFYNGKVVSPNHMEGVFVEDTNKGKWQMDKLKTFNDGTVPGWIKTEERNEIHFSPPE